jgi:hypothetical protein
VKSGGMLIVMTGSRHEGEGGVIVIEDLKSERDIVSDTGRRANEGIG